MKLFWILVLFINIQVRAEDVGDGSDGACTTATITSAKTTYQCTSLTIDADLDAFNGLNRPILITAPLIIKVQNNVVFNAGTTVDLSGEDGDEGNATAKNGGKGGAGGTAGGNSQLYDGATPATGHGLNGLGAGGGFPGKYINVPNSAGGGGGGGSYKTQSATTSEEGIDSSSTGLEVGSNGANGAIPPGISESNFETTFTGGFGGGAGGSGESGTLLAGSSGGGGGGAIRIIAGGNIVVNGDIKIDGGVGGGINSTPASGAGGGGSGGAIWLQAAGQLTINGTLSAIGGIGGETDTFPFGFGGNGGDGRIRLDDGDGNITYNPANVTPTPYTSTFTPTTTPPPGPGPTPGTSPISVRQYSSDVSCARVALDASSENFAINLILGMGLALGFGLLGKRKVRA